LSKRKQKAVKIYLKKGERNVEFNRHHRLPKVQGGRRTNGNITLVDVKSHRTFNSLVYHTAKYHSIDVSEVRTEHMAKFLNAIDSVMRLLVDPDSKKYKELSQIMKEFNDVWLPTSDPLSEQLISLKEKNN
jgi:hypothetical protein